MNRLSENIEEDDVFSFYYASFENDAKITSGIIEDEAIKKACLCESELFYLVKTGNLSRLRSFFNDEDNISSLFPRRLYKNIVKMQLHSMMLITQASFAASRDGLSHELLHSLLISHADSIESCHDPNRIPGLTIRSIYELTFLTIGIINLKNSTYSPLVNKCIEYIIKRMPEKLSLSDISKELHVTPKHISSLFNRDTGMSLSDFMQDLRIEEAKHLLIYTNLNYPEISNILCFGSQSYFNQVFRRKTGMTPKEFRNKEKGINENSYYIK